MASTLSLSYLSPLVLLLVAALAFVRPGRRPGGLPRWSEMAAFAALLLTARRRHHKALALSPLATRNVAGLTLTGRF